MNTQICTPDYVEREEEIIKLRDETSILREAVLEMQNFLRHPKQVAELSVESL